VKPNESPHTVPHSPLTYISSRPDESTLDHDYIFGDKNLQLSLKVYMAHIYVQGSHNLQVTQKSLIYMDMHKSQ